MAEIVRYREGGVTVVVGDEIRAYVERVISETAGVVLERIEAEITKVHKRAQTRWPVASGRSKAGLKTAITLDRDKARVEGGVLAIVPYSIYIKSFKGGLGGAHVWTVLVRKPVVNVKRRLAEELGDVIVKGRGKRRVR